MRFISERVKYPFFFFIPPPLTFVVNSTMTSLPPPPPVPLKKHFAIVWHIELFNSTSVADMSRRSDTNQFEFCPRFFKQLMSMFSPAYDNKIFASHELMASYYLF